MLSRRWLLLPLLGLAVGLLLASQRVEGTDDEPVEPLGLPGVREYRALAVDARDPKVMLLGTERGIFRTRDGGVRWLLAGLDGRSVTAIERRGPVYAAGGPGYAARSDDGGQTWVVAGVPPPKPGRVTLGAAIGATASAPSPAEPGVAYAIGGDGQLYRSGDAGATWQVAG